MLHLAGYCRLESPASRPCSQEDTERCGSYMEHVEVAVASASKTIASVVRGVGARGLFHRVTIG